jgi:hypothetical protein
MTVVMTVVRLLDQMSRTCRTFSLVHKLLSRCIMGTPRRGFVSSESRSSLWHSIWLLGVMGEFDSGSLLQANVENVSSFLTANVISVIPYDAYRGAHEVVCSC